jgi:hypothetical protein
MPLALIVIGLIMVVTGVRNTHAQFAAQLKSDLTGPGNFTYWIAAIGAIGAVGYIERLRPIANMFLALVIIAMLLSNAGFFTKLRGAIDTGPQRTSAAGDPELKSSDTASSGNIGDVTVSDIAKVAMFFV